MSDEIFRILLDLFMVSDPWPLAKESNDLLEAELNRESTARGYDAWQVAFHEFGKVKA